MPRDHGVGMHRRGRITNKKGAIMRQGLEIDSVAVTTLKPGTAIVATDTRENAKGVARANVRLADGTEGWISAKTMRCEGVATVRIRHCPGGQAG